jgi:hypothetical protein
LAAYILTSTFSIVEFGKSERCFLSVVCGSKNEGGRKMRGWEKGKHKLTLCLPVTFPPPCTKALFASVYKYYPCMTYA